MKEPLMPSKMETQAINYKKEVTLMARSLNDKRAQKAHELIKLLYEEDLLEKQDNLKRLLNERIANKDKSANRRRLSIEEARGFIAYFCNKIGFDIETTANRRNREYAIVRHCLFNLLRSKWEITLMEIGKLVCPKRPFDHSTVYFGANNFADLLSTRDAGAIAINQHIREAYLECFNKQLL